MKVNKLLKTNYKNNHKVSKITDNSKDCINNSIFIVNNKNRCYLQEAINNGAKTFISENDLLINNKYNVLIVENVKLYQTEILKEFYKKIVRKYKIIGITGTNGKTSTSTYIYKYLRHIKEDALLISSNGIYLDDLTFKTVNTTPSIFKIYDFLEKNLKKNKFKKTKNNTHYLILECSSQGIRELRLKHIPLDGLVITNITSDHMDYHSNYSDYFYSKCLLLNQVKEDGFVLVNTTNCNTSLIKEISNNKVYTFGVNGNFNYKILSSTLSNTIFEINNRLMETSIIGDFQIENITAAFGTISLLNFDTNGFVDFVHQLEQVPGRLKFYIVNNKNIIIDYAHTLAATSQTIEFIKSKVKNDLWVVIGCGGNRDKTKRPLIGEFVTLNSNFVIFTEDNNREEEFISIITDITKSITTHNYKIIENRFNAIKYALQNSNENDYILILGKGVEKTKINENYLTDYEIVKEIINV